MVCEKTMFQYIDGTTIWATLAEGAKVNLDLWNLFITSLISFNIISSKNNHFGFNSIKKINFSKKSHLNALGSKFDLDVK